jgi:hypothetical protein
MFWVVADAVIAPLIVVVVPFAEPIVIVVVEPDTPLVPMLIVLVRAFSVAPEPTFSV